MIVIIIIITKKPDVETYFKILPHNESVTPIETKKQVPAHAQRSKGQDEAR